MEVFIHNRVNLVRILDRGQALIFIKVFSNLSIMKVIKIYSDNDTLELFNNLIGKETVKINGEVVSTKYSFFGSTHTCSLLSNGEKVEYKVQFRPGLPASFDIYKDGKPIIESPPHGLWRSMFFGVVFVFIYELVNGRISFPF